MKNKMRRRKDKDNIRNVEEWTIVEWWAGRCGGVCVGGVTLVEKEKKFEGKTKKKAHYHYKFIYCLILINIQQHCVTI